MAKLSCWDCGEKGSPENPLMACSENDTHMIHKNPGPKPEGCIGIIGHNKWCAENPNFKPEKKKRSGGGGGFDAPYTPSKALAAVIGPEARPKSKMTQDIWTYFKEHNLQAPEDKRRINADKKLQPVFDALEKGRKQIGMTEVGKVLSLNSTKVS